MAFLGDFAKIENNRKCIVILEDLDSLISNFGESHYLEMLDSAKTIDNILFIATTNYPEKLDPRIYNRPGRFRPPRMLPTMRIRWLRDTSIAILSDYASAGHGMARAGPGLLEPGLQEPGLRGPGFQGRICPAAKRRS